MSSLVLDKKYFLAKGGERTCYIHPHDETKVIKVLHVRGKHNNQNDLEYFYIQYLRRHNKDLSQLSQCYNYIDTNKGKGLVFERIVDFDETSSKSFRYMLANQIISLEEQEELINELKQYLETNYILFIDTSLTNIFCQKISKDKYKLIIVDGLGAKRTGLKFILYKLSKLYTKYKIKKQWTKFMKMYNKDIKRMQLGQRPFTRL